MARSLNRVQLIGNLTRDPELRYTPTGTAVCSFSIATNRSWTTDDGEKHDETEFHRIVSWNKLAELCSQFLTKGRKVYVEGRLTTRQWTTQEGVQRNTTEIVIDDMILLDNKRPDGSTGSPQETPYVPQGGQGEGAKKVEEAEKEETVEPAKSTKGPGRPKKEAHSAGSGQAEQAPTHSTSSGQADDVAPDDIPF